MTAEPAPSNISRLDRWALWISAACLAHCVATTVVIAALATAGGMLGSPLIHQLGLVLAVIVGAVALGRGLLTHRRWMPLLLGFAGLTLMTAAVLAPHGRDHLAETVLTMAGVLLLSAGHLLNRPRRRAMQP